MPVLIVSEKTWPHDGFSRKRSIAAVLVGDDDPELERVLDRLEPDRDGGALLAGGTSTSSREVDVAERVAGDDEERARRARPLASRTEPAVPSGVSSTEYSMFMPERLAVAEVAADRLRQERDGDDHVLEAVLAQQLEDVLHARLADDRHHRLRLVRRQRAQARALAAGHDDGLHAAHLPRAPSRAYCAAATSASATPIQKSRAASRCPSCVTIMQRERRVEHPGRGLAERGSPRSRSRGATTSL